MVTIIRRVIYRSEKIHTIIGCTIEKRIVIACCPIRFNSVVYIYIGNIIFYNGRFLVILPIRVFKLFVV